jgi:hypothetical protein
MSVNKYQPHILVLPEDKANADIANGFIIHPNINNRTIQILPFVGGWEIVVEKFIRDHVSKLSEFPHRMIVLMIDFDRKGERLDYVKSKIPEDLKNRVFVLGVLSEPEDLEPMKKNFECIGNGKLEKIGEALAKDCFDKTNNMWGHDLLKHNQNEIDRMIVSVKPFLFNLQ